MKEHAKSRQKLQENLKVNPYPNYAAVIMEFAHLSHLNDLPWFVSRMNNWNQLTGTTH